jgi:hydroxymethylpyrimidine/phosphomethylpyrimidine kinase
VVTPNLDEACRLAKMKSIKDLEQMKEAAVKISVLGPHHVLIKGGHLAGSATDLLFDGKKFKALEAARVNTPNTHGTGCTYSAAITAFLARGCKLEQAVIQAKDYVTGGIKNSLTIGHGHGPLNHFWNMRDAGSA